MKLAMYAVGILLGAIGWQSATLADTNRAVAAKTSGLQSIKLLQVAHHTKQYHQRKKRYYKKKYKSRHKRRYYAFPKKRKATGRRVFIFSPRKKAWAAYNSAGNLVRTGRASGGKHYCADVKRACRTPRGVFRIRSKGSPGCKSSKFPLGRGGAPMPYCMFFLKAYAIHGSPDVPNYNASHGCIRVLPSAARWLSRNFIRIGTTVIVTPY